MKTRTSFTAKPLVFWIRILLGVIFVAASIDKIQHPEAFAKIIHGYRMLPDSWINGTAIVLPWLEMLVGLFLIAGLWLPGVLGLANVLLAVFLGSLLFNAARGLDVHCGCFSTGTAGKPEMVWYLFRDSVFLLLGAYVFHRELLSRPASARHRV